MQGTGLAEDGNYVTIDWAKNDQKLGPGWRDIDPVYWWFTDGKGGTFAEGIPWASVAISQNGETQLKLGDKVKIEGYCQTFTVTDTGDFGISQLDMFIGATTYQEALNAGRQPNVKVWKVIGE